MADTIDTIVRRINNSTGMLCSRVTVEQASKAFARLGEAFGNAASQLAGAAAVFWLHRTSQMSPRQQQLAIKRRRFKTRRLRKKYGQEL